MVKICMRNLPSLFAFVYFAAIVAGCASVSSQVTLLDPALVYAPTQTTAILFDFPPQPHVKIALIEVQGTVGGSEAELVDEGRKKAQALGANAIVRLEVNSVYQPPDIIYNPWFGYPYYQRYRYSYRPFPVYPYVYAPPYAFSQVGGGNIQTLKAVAIRYIASDGDGTK
jgi:hypothetical protein